MKIEVSQVTDIIIDGLHGELPPDEIAEQIIDLFYHNKSIVALPHDSLARLLTRQTYTLQKRLDQSERLVKDLEDDIATLTDRLGSMKIERDKLKDIAYSQKDIIKKRGAYKSPEVADLKRQIESLSLKTKRLKRQNELIRLLEHFLQKNKYITDFERYAGERGVFIAGIQLSTAYTEINEPDQSQ